MVVRPQCRPTLLAAKMTANNVGPCVAGFSGNAKHFRDRYVYLNMRLVT